MEIPQQGNLTNEQYMDALIESRDNIEQLLGESGFIQYNNYGNIVFVVGGGGSGKSFIANAVIGLAGYWFDVDEIKQMLLRHKELIHDPSARERMKDVTELSDPSDTAFMHATVKAQYEKPEYRTGHSRLEGFYRSALNSADKSHLPNLLFSITGKDVADIEQYAKPMVEAGYNPDKVHLIWVLTPLQVAKIANKERSRQVPESIIEKAHLGVRATMGKLIRHEIDFVHYLNGQIIIILNNFKSVYPDVTLRDNGKPTKDGKRPLKVLDKVTKIQIKDAKKPMKSMDEVAAEIESVTKKKNQYRKPPKEGEEDKEIKNNSMRRLFRYTRGEFGQLPETPQS